MENLNALLLSFRKVKQLSCTSVVTITIRRSSVKHTYFCSNFDSADKINLGINRIFRIKNKMLVSSIDVVEN